jgi:hypothetical protein
VNGSVRSSGRTDPFGVRERSLPFLAVNWEDGAANLPELPIPDRTGACRSRGFDGKYLLEALAARSILLMGTPSTPAVILTPTAPRPTIDTAVPTAVPQL